ncbi:hypothetical protein [Nonomuraea mesophila]|nr:hypothetical protein [Nonomuraea mesophila]
MQRVNACLGKSWATQFKKANLPYEGPRLQFVTSHVNSPCGP